MSSTVRASAFPSITKSSRVKAVDQEPSSFRPRQGTGAGTQVAYYDLETHKPAPPDRGHGSCTGRRFVRVAPSPAALSPPAFQAGRPGRGQKRVEWESPGMMNGCAAFGRWPRQPFWRRPLEPSQRACRSRSQHPRGFGAASSYRPSSGWPSSTPCSAAGAGHRLGCELRARAAPWPSERYTA